MATKKTAAKKVAKTSELKNRRAALRMTETDFDRMRYEVLPSEKTSWQGMLSEAVNAWLREHGHAPLEGVE